MSKHQPSVAQKGFTLMEAILAIGIIVVICFLAVRAFSRFRSNAIVNETKEEIKATLAEARSLTLASRSDTVYGVHFDADRIVRYTGSTYASTTASNVVYMVDPRVTIYRVSISGGSNVLFRRLTGETSNTGYVVFRLKGDTNRQATTTILGSGIIE